MTAGQDVGDAAGEAVGAGVEAGELGLERDAELGDAVDHERLDLGPRARPAGPSTSWLYGAS